MSDKKTYAPISEFNCDYCDRGRLIFESLKDDDMFSDYSDSDVIDMLFKGLHLANFVCKKCGEKTTRWVQYRKPYPDYYHHTIDLNADDYE